MPYSDNNPERRNLTVLSLGIIIYYAAGGCFDTKDGISFPLVKLHFYDPKMLVFFVWGALLWFAFKYLVSRNLEHALHIDRDSLIATMKHKFVFSYIRKKTKNQTPDPTINDPMRIYYGKNNEWYITGNNFQAPLNGFEGYIIRRLFLIKSIMKHRAATDYYTPYVVFWIALGMGIYNYIW